MDRLDRLECGLRRALPNLAWLFFLLMVLFEFVMGLLAIGTMVEAMFAYGGEGQAASMQEGIAYAQVFFATAVFLFAVKDDLLDFAVSSPDGLDGERGAMKDEEAPILDGFRGGGEGGF